MTIPSGTWPSTDANGIPLLDSISLTHQGTVVLLARKATAVVDCLYYNVMTASSEDSSDAGLWQGWNYLQMSEPNQSDRPLTQPSADEQPMLRIGGIDLITVPPLAKQLAPADAPFRAVSDGKYISVFRLSTDNTLYVDRFILVQGEAANATRSPATAMATTWSLNRAWEVRYRRSELRDVPDGSQDTLDCRNMIGEPFLEPTTEIALVPGLGSGGFDVAVVPSADPQASRWHFFSVSSGAIQCISFAQDATGRVLVVPGAPFSIQPLVQVSDGSTRALTLTAGISATVYSEREAVGDSGSPKVARAVRLMLAVPVACGAVNVAAGFALFDFLVQPEGTIPAWPAQTPVTPLDGILSTTGFTATAGASAYPIPDGAVHIAGTATVIGSFLGQPQPVASPLLYASSAGLVHLYFAGASAVQGANPFQVAQFDPTTTRAVAQLSWTAGTQSGPLAFFAQRPGSTCNGMSVTVSDCVGQVDLCNLSINYGAAAGMPLETWSGVPRALAAFVAVLNGNGAASAADAQVQAGDKTFFDYSGQLAQVRLPLGDTVAPSGFLALVATRPDLCLASVSVGAPVGGKVTLTLQYQSSAGLLTQTFAGVPVDGAQCATVLAGQASPAVYPYVPAVGDNAIYGLATEGGTLLLVNPASTAAVNIVVGVASDLNTQHCNIVLTVGSGAPVQLSNVGRDQASVVTALRSANVFTYVSPDPASASIVNQTVSSHLDLRAASSLFNVLPPTGNSVVVAVTVAAAVVQTHTLSIAPPGGVPAALYAAGVAPLTRPQFGQPALVPNGVTQLTTLGSYGSWCVAATPQALATAASSAVSVSLTQPSAQRLIPGRRWTIEAWANPTSGAMSRVLSYNNGAATELAGVVPSYFVGTTGLDSLQYQSCPSAPYSSSYVNVPADPQFDIASSGVTAFTWEAWVNANPLPCPASPSGLLGCIVQGQDITYPATALFELGLNASRTLVFGYRGNAGGVPTVLTFNSRAPLAASTWTHVAVTGQRDSGGWNFQLFINAVPDSQVSGAITYSDVGAPFVCLGANDIANVSLFGNLAELRYWKSARSRAELERTMNTTLTGFEPGLYGYWPLVEAPGQGALFPNRAVGTGTALDGRLQINQQLVTSSSDGTFVSVVAGVGGAPAVEAGTFMRSTHWNHIAVVYEACGALHLNPGVLGQPRMDYGRCDNPDDIGFTTQNSIEAWIQVPAVTPTAQTVLAQWGPALADQCFQFGVGNDGKPYFAINVLPLGGGVQTIRATATTSVCDGQPHHLAATWSVVTTTPTNGDDPSTSCTVTLYVDGALSSFMAPIYKVYMVQVASSKAPLTMGISALETPTSGVVALETQAPFQGVLTGLRVWTVTLSATQVVQAMQQNRAYDVSSGVVAAWWFNESSGLDAEDTVGDNDLVLSDTDMWCAFAHIADLNIYSNGVYVGRQSPYAATDYMKTQGFTIGAYNNGGTLQDSFVGDLTEFRLWATARSQNQIREAMYHPLLGSETALRAYWPFNGNLNDLSGGGNVGTPIGANSYVPSTAPVANEGPQVNNVYGGPVTDFQEPLFGRPAVLDYGDTELDSDGVPVGILRRCYFYNSPHLTLSTKYSVGELDLIYLGMAQTNPTLIGYIEGAPPVPSENLTRPLYNSYLGYNGYADAASVTLSQAEATSLSFSSSDYQTSLTMDLDWKLGLFGNWKGTVGSPFFSVQSFANKLKVGLHQKDNLLRAKQTDTKYLSSWTRTFSNSVGLRGTWEAPGTSPKDYLNPQVGRRYQPNNLGQALVESLTADVYAMCLKGSGASVGKVVIPNLEIPPDRNILVFQIDPNYVKNGTLDGKVGFVNDPSYPNADFERGSYFKPTEAYRLKAESERAEQDLLSYSEQFDAQAKGQAKDSDLSGPAGQQFYDFKADVARKSIVNTYVWDANGGLYKDEEQYASTYERVYNGFYSLAWSIGPLAEAEFAIGIGVFGGLDLLFGGQTKIQVGKSELQGRQLSLSVNAPGEPFLPSYLGDANYTLEPTPGKVTTYRFMSFFLPPSTSNADTFLDNVVNQTWKNASDDPGAIALRGARIRGNSVWRVLHRVTYVARVPPQVDGSPVQSAAPDQQWAIMLDDNLLLIQLVAVALGKQAPTPVNIGTAVATVLAPVNGSASTLGQTVTWWQTFVDTTKGSTPNAAAVKLLNRIVGNTCAYMISGYDTEVLPLPAAH